MGTYHLLVFTNAVEGRESEFDEWYEKTHLNDVLKTAGFHAAQRFGLEAAAGLAMPSAHLAWYEAEADSAQDVIDRLNSTRSQRVISDDMDASQFALWVFTPLGERHVLT